MPTPPARWWIRSARGAATRPKRGTPTSRQPSRRRCVRPSRYAPRAPRVFAARLSDAGMVTFAGEPEGGRRRTDEVSADPSAAHGRGRGRVHVLGRELSRHQKIAGIEEAERDGSLPSRRPATTDDLLGDRDAGGARHRMKRPTTTTLPEYPDDRARQGRRRDALRRERHRLRPRSTRRRQVRRTRVQRAGARSDAARACLASASRTSPPPARAASDRREGLALITTTTDTVAALARAFAVGLRRQLSLKVLAAIDDANAAGDEVCASTSGSTPAT